MAAVLASGVFLILFFAFAFIIALGRGFVCLLGVGKLGAAPFLDGAEELFDAERDGDGNGEEGRARQEPETPDDSGKPKCRVPGKHKAYDVADPNGRGQHEADGAEQQQRFDVFAFRPKIAAKREHHVFDLQEKLFHKIRIPFYTIYDS